MLSSLSLAAVLISAQSEPELKLTTLKQYVVEVVQPNCDTQITVYPSLENFPVVYYWNGRKFDNEDLDIIAFSTRLKGELREGEFAFTGLAYPEVDDRMTYIKRALAKFRVDIQPYLKMSAEELGKLFAETLPVDPEAKLDDHTLRELRLIYAAGSTYGRILTEHILTQDFDQLASEIYRSGFAFDQVPLNSNGEKIAEEIIKNKDRSRILVDRLESFRRFRYSKPDIEKSIVDSRDKLSSHIGFDVGSFASAESGLYMQIFGTNNDELNNISVSLFFPPEKFTHLTRESANPIDEKWNITKPGTYLYKRYQKHPDPEFPDLFFAVHKAAVGGIAIDRKMSYVGPYFKGFVSVQRDWSSQKLSVAAPELSVRNERDWVIVEHQKPVEFDTRMDWEKLLKQVGKYNSLQTYRELRDFAYDMTPEEMNQWINLINWSGHNWKSGIFEFWTAIAMCLNTMPEEDLDRKYGDLKFRLIADSSILHRPQNSKFWSHMSNSLTIYGITPRERWLPQEYRDNMGFILSTGESKEGEDGCTVSFYRPEYGTREESAVIGNYSVSFGMDIDLLSAHMRGYCGVGLGAAQLAAPSQSLLIQEDF
ncbi:MAG: hypothetical protein KDC26_09255 [Armatimonadetes bacterium]|nr:hypothetical protein [Armatimonadota bacterium]